MSLNVAFNIFQPLKSDLKVYNIYGLTEMSVWQSLVNVPIEEQSKQVPICRQENLLRETEIRGKNFSLFP